jgi:heptosyltransferase-1
MLPWGSEPERVVAMRLAAAIPSAKVLPRLELEAVALLLAGAACTVGVDTGLTHLSAALGTPTIAIFCASLPELTGVYGAGAARNLGAPGAPPGVQDVMSALHAVAPEFA